MPGSTTRQLFAGHQGFEGCSRAWGGGFLGKCCLGLALEFCKVNPEP